MALDTQDLWSIYAKGIATAAGFPDSPGNFILTGSSMIANLATGSSGLTSQPTTEEALFQVYNLANTEAHLSGIYDASQSRFFNDYATYIDNLIPKGAHTPTPTQSAKIRMLQGQSKAANKKYSDDQTSASKAWDADAKLYPNKYPTFQSFLNQTSWGGTLNTDNNNVVGINSQLSNIMTDVYGQDYVAIQANKSVVDSVRSSVMGASVNGPSMMKVSAASGELIVPTYNPSSLQTFSSFVDSAIEQHGSAQPISTTFTEQSERFDFSLSSYFSHTGWGVNLFFFSVGGSSTTTKTAVNINTSSSDFALTIEFDAVTQVSLARGPWYDSSLMYDYENPGSLATPTNLIVAMYPKIILKMDESSYNDAFSAFSTSNGFGIGAFWVVGGGHSSSSLDLAMHSDWDESSRTVTIASESIEPIIVAMQVDQVNDVS